MVQAEDGLAREVRGVDVEGSGEIRVSEGRRRGEAGSRDDVVGWVGGWKAHAWRAGD